MAQLADANLTATKTIADRYGDERADLSLPASVFGTTPSAPRLGTGSERAVSDLAQVLGRLMAAYENDMDKLYQTALAYQKELDDATNRAGTLTRP